MKRISRRKPCCGWCGKTGHNWASCSKRKTDKARLSPVDERYQDMLREIVDSDGWIRAFAQFVRELDWWCGTNHLVELNRESRSYEHATHRADR